MEQGAVLGNINYTGSACKQCIHGENHEETCTPLNYHNRSLGEDFEYGDSTGLLFCLNYIDGFKK